jgi:parallel beta-helix repeat protein
MFARPVLVGAEFRFEKSETTPLKIAPPPSRKPSRSRVYSTLLWVLLLSAAISPGFAQVVLNDSKLQVRLIASLPVGPVGGGNTEIYTAMAFIGPNDLLVLGKDNGKVMRLTNGLQNGTVLDLNVTANGFLDERGLLGIAVHPNFTTNGFVYLYYTKSNTAGDNTNTPLDNRVERYTWNGSALTNPLLIRSLPVSSSDHNGGSMTFGADGKLYFVIGDLIRSGQLQNNSAGAAPDDSGVIFRLNDDGTTPTDNPFFALGGNMARYYAYGIRNSFGIASDAVSGKIWMTENGLNDYDEINLVVPGFNSGWNKITGPDSRDPQGIGDLKVFAGSQYADPKYSWLSVVAPTGIAFVHSNQLGAAYQGDMFVGDFNTGNLYRFKLNGSRDGFVFQHAGLSDLVADNNSELAESILGNIFNISGGSISDLKAGPDGKLYVLNIYGSIYVIERNLTVNCQSNSLQSVIDDALPGDVITVQGICTENILIRNEKQRITITGNGSLITPSDGSRPAINVRGKGILLQNLFIGSGSPGSISIGIHVNRGSNAVINNNQISGNDRGIVVDELAFAVITNNDLSNNTGAAITVSENSTARIGFNSDADTDASPNGISGDGIGVLIRNGSSARIVGNSISSNSSDAIVVESDSYAELTSNNILSFAFDGVVVRENGSVRLGEDSGTSIFEAENDGVSTGFALRCLVGGVVSGRLGMMTGSTDVKSIAASCSDSLL